MKTLNKILLTLASILALISCEKDGEKIYLQSLGSDELIATTDNVVLSIETSQKVVLSFAWKGQDVHINDTTVGTAARAKNYMEISLSEDFSGQIYTDETVSNSIAYTCGELNSIVNGLGAKVGEANNVFFRLGSATGENIPYAYSNVVKVSVTPYEMDMNTGIIVESNNDNANLGETGITLYSPEANGIYSGFMFTPYAYYHYYLKEGNGLMWGTAKDKGAFYITSEAANRQNMWFPGSIGCYYVNVNTKEEKWDALYISSLTVAGLTESPVNLTLDKDNSLWIASFPATEAGDKVITISGSGEQWNVETGTTDGAGIPTNVALAADENNNIVLADNAGNISVTIPQAGECTIKLDLINPNDRKVYVEAGGTDIPSQYPATVDVQRWDGTEMVSMVMLQRTDSENGIYQGTYDGAYLKNDEHYGFEFIADGTWYRADASDNTKLAISNNSLSKFFFNDADDKVTSINVTITVNLKELSWSYVINSQVTGGGDEGDETYPNILYMVKWVAADQPYNILLTLNESETPGIYTGNYTGTGNPGNFSFIDPKETQASNNQISEDETWVWYGKESDDQLYKLKEDGSDLWFASPYWSESNVNYTITVDLTQMSWSITNNN